MSNSDYRELHSVNQPQKIGIHFCALDDTEDLAFDDVKHVLPCLSGDGPETGLSVGIFDVRNSRCRGGEPYFEELFWALEGCRSLNVNRRVCCHECIMLSQG